MQSKSDLELMRLVLLNERAALEELYDRYAKLVYSFALKSMKREEAAREIVQLVFTRLWTTEKGYDPDKGQFVNWLLTITRNMTIDQLRKERRHKSVLPLQPEQWEEAVSTEANEPERILFQNLLKEQIQHAYQFLSDSQIKLIEHFYWQGYTLSDIADKFNEPVGTIKSRLHQSLKILRKHLQEQEEG